MLFERLETRTLFAVDPGNDFAHALNVGDLNGQQTFSGAVNVNNLEDFYKFTMPRAGTFFGRLRVMNFPAQLDLFQQVTDSKGNVQEKRVDFVSANLDGPDGGFASGDMPAHHLSAGTYFLEVSARGAATNYLMRMTADYAGDKLTNARDIGSATDATFQDFIGEFPSPSLEDPIDTYKIKMDAQGSLLAELSLDTNAQPASFQAHLALILDANHNNIIDPNEKIFITPAGNTALVSETLRAGTYFLQVINDVNFSNYHLHINADYAGTTPGTIRQTGSLDSIRTFNDFVGKPDDPLDHYSFNVSQTRTLFVGLSDSVGSKALLSVFLDRNNNGVADANELIESTLAQPFASLLMTVFPGHYFLEVEAFSGSGTYTLSAEARPDQAGNTLKTAKNLGTINGLTHVDDYVSPVDPVDLYKFTASAAGTIGASVFSDFSPDTDLALIRDANNNGIIDKGDVQATGTTVSTGGLELTHSISPGTYFLRVSTKDTFNPSKYFLSFQTDYAGATPKGARNVGSLFGTKSFDDWASGPFTGAISDTADVYKFSLSSTRTFSAKLVGILGGQDLDLQLFQDKNKDGMLSSNELISSSHKPNSASEQISKSLATGTYFVKVVGVNGETNYHLTLNA